MGWLFTSHTRSELIRDLTADEDNQRCKLRVLAHALRGNVLWTLTEVTAKVAGIHTLAIGQSMCLIGCNVLEKHGDKWGYKSMDESVHPYYYSCPLSYLKMAKELSPEWRQAVRAWHAQQHQAVA